MSKVSSYIVIRNGISGDYCFREAIESLLPISDEVVVSDAESDDGTSEVLRAMALRERKLRIITKPWVQPVNNPRWFVTWLNETRQQLRHPFQMTLDADEVLDEGAYPIVRAAAQRNAALWFHRINYVRDARTVIAAGETCGVRVVRCGPTHLWMPSDEPYPSSSLEPLIRKVAEDLNPLPVIHHYGFLRSNSGMFAKSRIGLMAFFGAYDDRLTEAEKHPDKPWWNFCQHQRPFTRYEGEHPKCAVPWLKERGVL